MQCGGVHGLLEHGVMNCAHAVHMHASATPNMVNSGTLVTLLHRCVGNGPCMECMCTLEGKAPHDQLGCHAFPCSPHVDAETLFNNPVTVTTALRCNA
jgi:hypothetical protein